MYNIIGTRIGITVAGLCSGASSRNLVKALLGHCSSVSCKNVGPCHHMNELAKSMGCKSRDKMSAELLGKTYRQAPTLYFNRYISPTLLATKSDHLREDEDNQFKATVESDHRKM